MTQAPSGLSYRGSGRGFFLCPALRRNDISLHRNRYDPLHRNASQLRRNGSVYIYILGL